MLGKRKLAEILSVSFLLSVSIVVILLNFFFLGPTTNENNESFAGTFLFIAVYICATAVAYVLKNRFVLRFVLGYFAFTLVCSVITLFISFFDVSYNALLTVIAAPPIAFLGAYVLIPLQYTVSILSVIFSFGFMAAAFFMLRKIAQKETAEAVLHPHVCKNGKN